MDRSGFLKFVDSTLGDWLCRVTGAFSAQKFPVAEALPENVRKILVIRPGGIGDMIMLLPILQVIRARYPAAELDLLCEKRNMEVLILASLPVRALAYDAAPLSTLAALRRRHYDLVIDSEQFHHFSSLFAWFSRAPVRIGFKINPRRNSLYTHLVNYAPDGFEGDQFSRLLNPLGIECPIYRLNGVLADCQPSLRPGVATTIAEFASAGPFAAVHPGASTPFKEWPTGRFVELIAGLRQDDGTAVALVGNHGDTRKASRTAAEARKLGCRVEVFAGSLTLGETASLIRQARLFVGTDSGLSHLAVALGRPSVTIFGPSDHSKWGVQDSLHAVVKSSLPCSPCFIFGYHKTCRTISCMQQTKAEAVLSACRRVTG